MLARAFWRATQRTAADVLAECGVAPASALGAVLLGQYGDAGVRPDKLSAALFLGVVAHYLQGSRYPVGGSGALPLAMNAVVRAAGGVTFVQARVAALLPCANAPGRCAGVVLATGESIAGRCVVSGIGAAPSFQLLRSVAPRAAGAALARLRASHEYSTSFVFLFCAIDLTRLPAADAAGVDRSAHNRWIYPHCDYIQMEKDYAATPPNEAFDHPLPMFVSSGSAKDARRGSRTKKTVVVLSQCPWGWVARFAHLGEKARARDPAYQAFKAKATAALLRQGFRRVFPQLEKAIAFTELGTPLSTNTFLGKERGECYGRAAVPAHWGCPDLVPQTACANFYLTGQDIGTLGVAGAISAGYLTANAVAGYGRWTNVVRQSEIALDLGEPSPYAGC